MNSFVILSICVFGAAYGRPQGFVSTGSSVSTGTGAGFGPGFTFPNIIPPLIMPQIPIPIVPIPTVPIASGGTVVSRFSDDAGTTTYVQANPYGGYTKTTVTNIPAPQGQSSIINSRFNDDNGGTSHTSTVVSGSGTGGSTFVSSGGTGGFVQTIPTAGGISTFSSSGFPAAPGVLSARFGDDGPAHVSSFGSSAGSSGLPGGSTSTFTSSSNVNGQGETVVTTNNNGHVQTYRQSSGK